MRHSRDPTEFVALTGKIREGYIMANGNNEADKTRLRNFKA